jgi:hypothetical protein
MDKEKTMLRWKLNVQNVRDGALVLLGILVLSSLIYDRVAARPQQMQGVAGEEMANAAAAPEASPDEKAFAVDAAAPEDLTWVSCTPNEVMAYTDSERIHVLCAESFNGVRYFALGTEDAASVARILSVLTTAQVAGRTLSILYDTDDVSGESIGCNPADCRLILGAGFGQ